MGDVTANSRATEPQQAPNLHPPRREHQDVLHRPCSSLWVRLTRIAPDIPGPSLLSQRHQSLPAFSLPARTYPDRQSV